MQPLSVRCQRPGIAGSVPSQGAAGQCHLSWGLHAASPMSQHRWPCLPAWSLTAMGPHHWSPPYSRLCLHPPRSPPPATFGGRGDSAPGKHQACQGPFLHVFSRRLQSLASNSNLFGAHPVVFFKLVPSSQRLPPSLLPAQC